MFLCAPFFSSAGGNLDSLFAEARQLFNEGRFAQSAIAFEYVIYKSESSQTEATACLAKSQCYKHMGNFERAFQCLERVNIRPLDDTLHYHIRSEMALLLYLQGAFTEADNQFKQMDFFLRDFPMKRDSYYLRVLIANELRNWDQARTAALEWVHMLELSAQTKDSLVTEIKALYAEAPKMRKPHRAEFLSSFVPGLGHVYAGAVGEGAVSFLLSVGALTYVGFNILSGNYVTALTLGTGMLQLFLFGGVRRSKYLTERRNYNKSKSFNTGVRDLIVELQRLK